MSREIKFRGLRVKYEKGWHDSAFKYGNLLNVDTIGEVGAHLNSYEYAEVKPETVGQFTGRKDKNGIDIYEGDILKCTYTYYSRAGGISSNTESFVVKDIRKSLPTECDLEVIGNIHEHSNLLNETT